MLNYVSRSDFMDLIAYASFAVSHYKNGKQVIKNRCRKEVPYSKILTVLFKYTIKKGFKYCGKTQISNSRKSLPRFFFMKRKIVQLTLQNLPVRVRNCY